MIGVKSYSYIKYLFIDLDGVLTDGKYWVDSSGNKSKSFNSRDSRAIKDFIAHGYEVYIITASSWSGAARYCENLGVRLLVRRDKDISDITDQPYIFIADDSWDLNMLNKAELAFCPADAYSKVKELEGIYQLNTKGGDGCIAELADLLLDS